MRRLKVAVAGPLSGNRAAYGHMIRECVSEHCHSALDIHIYDDQALPSKAVQVAEEIVADSTEFVVGHFNSDCATRVKEIYSKQGIPFFLPASTMPGLADGRHTFRLCPNDHMQAEKISSFLNEYRFKKQYVWLDGSEYAKRLMHFLEKSASTKICAIEDLGNFQDPDALLVFLGSHANIMEAMRESSPELKRCIKICCDDCFIDEFCELSYPGIYVCAPDRPFKKLLADAFSIIENVFAYRRTSLSAYFDASGESLVSSFEVYKLENREFIISQESFS